VKDREGRIATAPPPPASTRISRRNLNLATTSRRNADDDDDDDDDDAMAEKIVVSVRVRPLNGNETSKGAAWDVDNASNVITPQVRLVVRSALCSGGNERGARQLRFESRLTPTLSSLPTSLPPTPRRAARLVRGDDRRHRVRTGQRLRRDVHDEGRVREDDEGDHRLGRRRV
jgi:hypothetical protein